MSTEFEPVSFGCKTGVMTSGTLTVPDIHGSRAIYRPTGENVFRKLREILGFHVTLTVQQPKGRCVWGLRPRSRSLGS